MRVKRRRLPNFESCSVALFASLAMGSTALPARAQAAAPSARTVPSAAPSAPVPLRLTRRTDLPPPVVPDGSISSPGFDESLK